MDKLRHADGGALQRPGDHGDHLGRLSGGRDLALRTISLPLFDPFSPVLPDLHVCYPHDLKCILPTFKHIDATA